MPLSDSEGESLKGEDDACQRVEEELATALESVKCKVEQRIWH